MRVTKFNVLGFRSLADVAGIPVSKPTILAGCNDSGKTAVLAALAFLVGAYDVADEDRTYVGISDGAVSGEVSLVRCPVTEVEGSFELDSWEQKELSLSGSIKIRRRSELDKSSKWEIWTDVPQDARLRDLSVLKVPELKAIAAELGIGKGLTRRAELEAVLRDYVSANSTIKDWMPLPLVLLKRLPVVLRFDGKSTNADDAVKAVLGARVKDYVNDPDMQGRLRDLEQEVQDNLRVEAKSLCDHILKRCPDLASAVVEPDITFTHGFHGAPLRIARKSGEPVSLERSGLGSSRRISLAVWEWTSNLLSQDDNQQEVESGPLADKAVDEPPSLPVQKILIYDEPDTHLDYAHQRTIMRIIRDQSAIEHVNVMVATHSMNLIDGVDISDVVHLHLDNDRTAVELLADDSHEIIDAHLGEIAASLGIRNSVLLHERCFLAVEGETEQQAFPILFRLSENMSLQAAGIALWGCGNNEGALQFAKYLVARKRTVMLVVDADSRNLPKSIFKPDRLAGVFGKDTASIVSMLGESQGMNEFEEIFSDEVWARVANNVWPRDLPWEPDEFKVLRSSKKFSESALELLKSESSAGPNGKPQMMFQLATCLTDPTDIPEELREIFSRLRVLAD